MPQREPEELTRLGARVPISLKKRLDKYCAGAVDGQRHFQEDVVFLSVTRYLNMAEKTGKILEESEKL